MRRPLSFRADLDAYPPYQPMEQRLAWDQRSHGGKSNEASEIGPFGYADKPAEKHCWLICCERKILFRLKKQAEKTDYRAIELTGGASGHASCAWPVLYGRATAAPAHRIFIPLRSGVGAPRVDRQVVNSLVACRCRCSIHRLT
jgi:hypothetical protein